MATSVHREGLRTLDDFRCCYNGVATELGRTVSRQRCKFLCNLDLVALQHAQFFHHRHMRSPGIVAILNLTGSRDPHPGT